MIKTVKDLKDYLNTLPEDAYVYEQLTTNGKHLEAINPKPKLEYPESHDGELVPVYLVTHKYEFPDFVQIPLSTENTLDILNRYYNNLDK